MPIRLTCPSCSATLSVKDEYAGRAVKCPKCGGVIPASQPAAPAPSAPTAAAPAPPPPPEPAPAPAAEKSPFEELDEPAKPAKVTGRPVARAKSADEDEERPRRKRDEEEDGDEDRPRRKRRDDDDGPPRGSRGKPKGKSNVGMILLLIGGFLFLCCSGVVGAGYYAWTAMRDKVKEELNPKNDKVNFANYEKVKLGMTRGEVEGILGPGKLADRSRLVWISNGAEFTQNPHLLTPVREEVWNPKIDQGRVYYWQNDSDAVFLGFHPDGGKNARVQMKEYISKNGKNDMDTSRYSNDAVFAREFGAGKQPIDTPGIGPGGIPAGTPGGTPGGMDEEPPPGPLTEVNAEELARAYADNESAADAKYKGKWLLVQGKVKYISPDGKTERHDIQLDGVKKGKFDFLIRCACRQDEASKVLNLSRGQTVTLEGKCAGNPAKTFVRLDHCRVKSSGPDPAIKTTAADLIREFVDDYKAANAKYMDKEVFVTDAVVLTPPKGGTLVTFRAEPKGAYPLQANFTFDQQDQLAKLKPGDKVKFRARAGLLFGAAPNQYVSFYEAYFVP